LGLNVDLSKLDATAEDIKKILEAFGLIRNLAEEKKKEEQQLRWFI
jgi:predicted ATP-grasp superfamily ATP-dependent carboligase